jgi:hypothetical protein
MALLHKLDCPRSMVTELWEHAASGRTPPRWVHDAHGWAEAADLGDYLGAHVPLFPPLLPSGRWEVVDHLWALTPSPSDAPTLAAAHPAVPGARCEGYCVEACAQLNGDVVAECGACDGPAYACRRGADGFPLRFPNSDDELTEVVATREARLAARDQDPDRCHGLPHSLRWLLGRLLAADPAMRGPPAALLSGLERLERLGGTASPVPGARPRVRVVANGTKDEL